jgi:hypothetical protein
MGSEVFQAAIPPVRLPILDSQGLVSNVVHSVSWSGLLYLAFFLCSKFAIHIPFLRPKRQSPERPRELDAYIGSEDSVLPLHHNNTKDSADQTSESLNNESADLSGRTLPSTNIPPRNQAAAPPVYLLALPLVPICAAIYITSTRYFQFFHHGFDMLFGTLIGVLSAWFAFRWYHLPISQGAGWSWGARTRDRAWAIGVGVPGYVGTEGWASKPKGGTAKPEHPVLGPGYDGSRESAAREEQQQSDGGIAV